MSFIERCALFRKSLSEVPPYIGKRRREKKAQKETIFTSSAARQHISEVYYNICDHVYVYPLHFIIVFSSLDMFLKNLSDSTWE